MVSKIECHVIDAGARYGLHPSWQPAQKLVTFDLFETDVDEANRLQTKYASFENISVFQTALFSRDCRLTFNIRKHRALNSIYETNKVLLDKDQYMAAEHAELGHYEVEARSLDSLYTNRQVHFLKLDTEGAELEILQGGQYCLQTSILGVRAEVPFAPILKDAPGFGDIHQFMLDHDFELLNLDYTGKGSSRSAFTKPDRFGKLMSTDAVWIANKERVFRGTELERRDNTVRFAYFLMLNNATDVALEMLLLAVRDCNIQFGELWNDPLFLELHRLIAHLFKDLSYLPSMETDLLAQTYHEIFERDFPKLNEFYENSLLN